MGVAHHSVYTIWCEQARVEKLRELGYTHARMEAEGKLLAVVELKIRYRAPAHYDELLRVEALFQKASAARLWVEHRVFEGARLLCEGEVVLACLDSSGRPQRLPKLLCELFNTPEESP